MLETVRTISVPVSRSRLFPIDVHRRVLVAKIFNSNVRYCTPLTR